MISPKVFPLILGLAYGPLFAAGDSSPDVAFKQATEAYRAKEYSKALNLYRGLAEKIRNPVLFYNWGNSAFKQGHLGEAILAMEKAHRISPRDADVRANLAFMRARVKDSMPEDDTDIVTRILVSLLGRMALNELLTLSSFSLWLCVLSLCGLLVIRRPNVQNFFKVSLFGGLTLLIVALGPGLIKYYLEEVRQSAIILAKEVQVLSGPASDEIKRFSLHEGTRVRVLKEWDKWVQISLPNGENGWTLGENIGRI